MDFEFGDVVKMQLNVPKRKLIFDKGDGLVSTDINMHRDYHLVINLTSIKLNDYVQLLDFNVQGYNTLFLYSSR